jgi:polar amino acid transport system substrate-binding protein
LTQKLSCQKLVQVVRITSALIRLEYPHVRARSGSRLLNRTGDGAIRAPARWKETRMRYLSSAAAVIVAATVATSGAAVAQQAPSPEVMKDLAPTGKLRAAINYGNNVLAQRGPNGEPRGVSVDLAAALGKRLGVPVEYVAFEAAGKSLEAVAKGQSDIGFVAVDPDRGKEVDFTAPYVVIEGTYMVPNDSPLKEVGDVDRPGVRIGIGLQSVYDLYLTRELKHAKLVRAPVGGASAGIPVFVEQKLEAAAGVRQALDFYAKDHPEVRVMTGAFQQIRQAMVTPKNKAAGLAYMKVFVEEMKASGMVVASLKASGMAEVSVAPPEK